MKTEPLEIDRYAENAEMGRDLGESPLCSWVIRAIAVALGLITACGIYLWWKG